MKTPHLNNLRALEAVLRNGSLTAAAEELSVTTAAVSQQIRLLEAWLDQQLFERTPVGLVPVDAAREIAGRLTAAFLDIEDILTDLSPHAEGRLRVTMTQFFASNWMTERLPAFNALRGDILLEVDAIDRVVDLAIDPLDFAIRFCPGPPEGTNGVPLFGECAFPVCTPGFARQHDLSTKRTDLSGVPLIHLTQVTSDPSWPSWQTWLARFGFSKTDCGSDTTLFRVHAGLNAALASAGLVICGVTESFVSLREGTLIAPFGTERHIAATYAYHILWREGRRLSPSARTFRDWITAEAEAFREKVRSVAKLSIEHPSKR